MEKKIALVTGANRGIGFETVRQLLKKDYVVLLTSRKEKDGQQAIQQLKDFENLYYHPLDVTDQESVNSILAFVKEKFDRLDVLINNAAIHYDIWQDTEHADLNTVLEALDTNLLGPWRMAQAFIPLMKKQKFGRIVNVSSGSGSFAEMGSETPAYGISKAALNALTLKLGLALKNTGILVNAVCPGWVRTDMGGQAAPRSPEKGAETIIWLAELPADGPTAKFFRDKKEISF